MDEHARSAVPRGLVEQLRQAARDAGDTLLRAAILDRGGLAWPIESGGGIIPDGLHWCNGPTGIRMFLIRLAAATGDARFADAARQCALATRCLWTSPPGHCCGLAGAGHLLLDLADSTGESRWRTDAAHIAEVIAAHSAIVDGLRVSPEPKNGYSYVEGTAGVLDFLIRFVTAALAPGCPRASTDDCGAVNVGRLRR
jgi:hypothetical protein